MHFNHLLALVAFQSSTLAFRTLSPSYINSSAAYEVSSIEEAPSSFIKRVNKQTVLQSLNATSSGLHSTTELSSSSSSSTASSSPTKVQLNSGLNLVLSDSNSESYSINITIDSIDYPLLIDTGSPYLWIYGSNCTDESCEDKQLYHALEDESIETFDLAYSSGSASGIVVQNDLIIAGLEDSKFAFGVADSVPDIFESYSFSGVLGLPSSDTSSTGMKNLIASLHNESVIEESKFSLCLGEYNTSTNVANAGLFIIGDDAKQLYTGDVYYTDVLDNDNSYWEIKIESLYIDGYQATFDSMKVDGESSKVSRLGVIDSGTTSIIASSADAVVIHSYFDDAVTDGENFAIFCNSTLTLDFEIGGHNFSLTSDQYIGQAYSKDSGYYGYCVSNIQGLDSTTDGSWILGALFLNDRFAVFDYDNAKVGFAERNENVILVPAPTASATTTSKASNSMSSTAIATKLTSGYTNSTTFTQSSMTSSQASSSTASHNAAFKNTHDSLTVGSLLGAVLCLLI